MARNGGTETVITAALLAQIAAGDRDAFRQLYDAIYQGLYRFIMRVIGDQHLAEDVTNETLMDVWRQAGRYRGAAQPRTWIYSIGHNKAVSALRKRREGALDTDTAERIEDPGPTPCTAASDSSRARLIQSLMAELTADHRAVLQLTYYEGLSIRDIAAVMDCPENTVKTRMFHARKRFKALLEAANITVADL